MPVTLSEAGGLSGSGTTNYIPKWTPDGFTLGNSIVYDDGTNVGFGTTSPTARGHFKGATSVGVLPTDYAAKFDNSSNAPLLYIRNDGNVGIGISNPTEKLNVSGRVRINTTATDYAYSIWDNSNNIKTQIGYNANGSLIQTYNGILMLNPTGLNVGIGSGIATNAKLSFGNYYVSTSSPTSEQQTSHIKLYDGGVGGSFYGFGISSGIKDFLNIAANGGNANIAFYTNSTQKMVITTDGNVGIGTSTPTSKLQVVGLPTYADNAAALGAGLTAGAMYIRTGHGLDIVV